MSRNARLPHHETIYQYLQKPRLDLYYSKPVLNHMVHFIDGVTQKGFSGNLRDIHSLSHEKKRHSTLSYFFQNGKWDGKVVASSPTKTSLTARSAES